MPQVPKTHVLEEGCRTLLLGQRNAPSQGVSRRKGLARSGISRRSFVPTLWLRCAYAPGGLARVSRGSRERRGLAKVVATLYLRCSYGVATHGGVSQAVSQGPRKQLAASRGAPLSRLPQLLAGAPCSRSFSLGSRVLCPYPPRNNHHHTNNWPAGTRNDTAHVVLSFYPSILRWGPARAPECSSNFALGVL